MLLTFIIIYLLATIGIGIWAGSRVKPIATMCLRQDIFSAYSIDQEYPSCSPSPLFIGGMENSST